MALTSLILMCLVSLGSPPRHGAAVDPGGAVTQEAGGVQPVDHHLACGRTDQVLPVRSLGGADEQIDLRAAGATTGRMLCVRRVDARTPDPAAASQADYGIVRGPPAPSSVPMRPVLGRTT